MGFSYNKLCKLLIDKNMNKQDFIIRSANIEDYCFIYRLNCEQMGYDFDLEKTKIQLKQLLDCKEHKIFVAVFDSEIVGYVHANNYELTYSDPLKNIMGIAVSAKVKRKGIGRLLLKAVEEWAKDSEAVGVRLVSGEKRTEAHNFYEACGYKRMKNQVNFTKIF